MSIKSGYFDFLYLIDFYLMLQIHMIHQSSLLILLINESCNLIGWKQSKSKENVSKEAFYLVRNPQFCTAEFLVHSTGVPLRN